MNILRCFASVSLLAVLGTAVSAQRVEFERKKFDRSRFERAEPAAPQAPAATTSATMPAAPAPAAAPAAPEFSAPAAPAPAAATGAATNWSAGAPSSAAPMADGSYDSPYPKGATDEQKALIDSPKFDLVPSKWFNHFKDYAELEELQKQSGACMLVYFKNLNVSDEKGLCGWFEKDIANSREWRKAMDYYLKIEIPVAGGNDVLEALLEKFRVKKTPAVFVVKPNGSLPQRLPVIEYIDGKPKPFTVPVVIEALKVRSSPAYKTLF